MQFKRKGIPKGVHFVVRVDCYSNFNPHNHNNYKSHQSTGNQNFPTYLLGHIIFWRICRDVVRVFSLHTSDTTVWTLLLLRIHSAADLTGEELMKYSSHFEIITPNEFNQFLNFDCSPLSS